MRINASQRLLESGTYAQWVTALSQVENPRLVVALSNPFSALSFAKKIVTEFKAVIETVLESTKIGIKEIVLALKSKNVFNLLKTLGFNLKKLFVAVQKVAHFGPKKILQAFQQIEKAGYLDKLKSGALAVDDFLKKFPVVAKVGGPAVAALLLVLWMHASFTGHLQTDLDMTPIFMALVGKYSLHDLFTTPEALTSLSNVLVTVLTAGTSIAVVIGIITYLNDSMANLFLGIVFTGLVAAKKTGLAKQIYDKYIKQHEPIRN